jgi:predicted metalloprotease with PDZ domain
MSSIGAKTGAIGRKISVTVLRTGAIGARMCAMPGTRVVRAIASKIVSIDARIGETSGKIAPIGEKTFAIAGRIGAIGAGRTFFAASALRSLI